VPWPRAEGWRACLRRVTGFKVPERVALPDGTLVLAELHWYEAHGIGRRDMKVKRLLE